MFGIIDKESKTALSVQVSENLISEIRDGGLKSGKRMPGIRVLSDTFGVSKSTVIDALGLLEKQNYIERIPSKGTFVADDVNHELEVLKIAFAFPTASISVTSLGHLENWGIVSETYRGLIEESEERSVEVSFIHLENTQSDLKLSRQIRRLRDYDGVIFVSRFLSSLRERSISEKIPCVQISPSASDETNGCPIIAGNINQAFKDMAKHLNERAYERLWVLTEGPLKETSTRAINDSYKIRNIKKHCAKLGIETLGDGVVFIDETGKGVEEALNDKLLSNGKNVVFCNRTDFVVPFYKFCMAQGLKIGEDIGVFAYASGITFNNLIPELSYSKIDHYEMGKVACEVLTEGLRKGTWQSRQEVLNKLVVGEST